MATEFEPDERQKRLIAEAQARATKAGEDIHHASEELVRRMTLEGAASMLTPENEGAGGPGPAVSAFRIRLAAAIDQPVTRDVVMGLLGGDACRSTTVFRAPRHIVLLEFEQAAETHDLAVTACISKVLRGFAEAELIDLTDPNALIDELVEASQGRAPTPRELVRLMRSDAPSIDALAKAAAGVDGLLVAAAERVLSEDQLTELLSATPDGRRVASLRLTPGAGARLLEAEVFEVWPQLGLAHLMSDGGTMFAITDKTPGISSLEHVDEGQRYECVVTGRFNLVVYAGLVA